MLFKNVMNFFKKSNKKETKNANSKDKAKERLHLVLMQDRANVSVDFLDLMRQEIIEVIKKYIDIDEELMDVRLENRENEDGTQGAPALYANIPIINIKESAKKMAESNDRKEEKAPEQQQKQIAQDQEIKKEENTQKQEQVQEKEQEKIEENKEQTKVEEDKEQVAKVTEENNNQEPPKEKNENNTEKESGNE